ncbi:MAG: HNH endonuclease [Planctomycetaceae bacterium]
MDATFSTLDDRTLVLNRSWAAITTTSVRHALCLVYQRVARVICPDTYETHDFDSWSSLAVARDEPQIRTVSLNIRVPEVIVLALYDGYPSRKVAFSRRNLYRRDQFTCQYCGCRPGSEELSIDHILPRSRGGRTTWENCALACVECNKRKSNRTPVDAGMRLLRVPRIPRWSSDVEIAIGRRKASWENFISDRYWNTELED